MLSPEYEAGSQDLRENPRCLGGGRGGGAPRVTLIECKCCGKPKLLIRFGTAWERYRGLRTIPSTSKRQTHCAGLDRIKMQSQSYSLDHFVSKSFAILHHCAFCSEAERTASQSSISQEFKFLSKFLINFYKREIIDKKKKLTFLHLLKIILVEF